MITIAKKVIFLCCVIIGAHQFQRCTQPDTRTRFYNEDSLLVIRNFYPDGTIEKERTYRNDTLDHGYGKELYPDGTLKHYVELKNGLKDGKSIFYFQNGNVEIEGWYIEGMQDSTWTWYDSLGNIKSKRRYVYGATCGQGLTYSYNNSKTYLSHCLCYEPDSTVNLIYKARFDSLGRKIEEQGKYYPIMVFDYSFPQLEISEVFNVELFLCPCASDLVVLLSIVDSKNNKPVDEVKVKRGQEYFNYSYKFKTKGEFKFILEQGEIRREKEFSVR